MKKLIIDIEKVKKKHLNLEFKTLDLCFNILKEITRNYNQYLAYVYSNIMKYKKIATLNNNEKIYNEIIYLKKVYSFKKIIENNKKYIKEFNIIKNKKIKEIIQNNLNRNYINVERVFISKDENKKAFKHKIKNNLIFYKGLKNFELNYYLKTGSIFEINQKNLINQTYGKGIYFSRNINKALNYCDNMYYKKYKNNDFLYILISDNNYFDFDNNLIENNEILINNFHNINIIGVLVLKITNIV